MFKRILLLGVIALASGVGVRLMTAAPPAAAIPASGINNLSFRLAAPTASPASKEAHTYWETVWTRPAPGLCAASLSPNGQSVAWVDGKGSIRRLDAAGRTLWQTGPQPGANTVVSLPEGDVLTYSRLNPAAPYVRVLDAKTGGGRVRTYPVEGAIWSTAVSSDGKQLYVGTGHSLLYIFPLAPVAPLVPLAPAKPAPIAKSAARTMPPQPALLPLLQPRKIQTPGIAETLVISKREPVVIAGTWEDTGWAAWGGDGSPRWGYGEPEGDRSYRVTVSANGSTAVAVTSRGAHHRDARLLIYNAQTGQLLSRQELNGSDAHVLVSADGTRVAVTYARTPADGSDAPAPGTSREWRVALFDRQGNRAFGEKGGLYFAPELVALSADGKRITVRDNDGYLWTLDDHGRMLSRMKLHGESHGGANVSIQETQVTPDGTYLLIRRGDDFLTLLKSVTP